MCIDCGCNEANHQFVMRSPSAKPSIAALPKTLHIGRSVLEKNNLIAASNQGWFDTHAIKAINIMSSPGSGKTTLLEKSCQSIKKKVSILVGDLQTDIDANRLKKAHAHAKQINTDNGCHLDAQMISLELGDFISGDEEILIIENVGNLVCPASFDLGEHFKIALLSVTEGEEKPLKYPSLFYQADLVLITKIDLIKYVPWDEERAYQALYKVNPKAKIIQVSATTGEGMEQWMQWLGEL